ncbi:hypothetical protein GALMADRAFT_1209290 [Galerina marginata CBS 339.88]|uniref:Uncharacterized protein n=1 Tax=Galerina marginata (strain CBS 339.88) TaxID=685588 RepID=A0A067S5P1_GALM3|nr:hypothetical protein GALMADRAFT_1209290 [Galerina marginata CBS 339.88]
MRVRSDEHRRSPFLQSLLSTTLTIMNTTSTTFRTLVWTLEVFKSLVCSKLTHGLPSCLTRPPQVEHSPNLPSKGLSSVSRSLSTYYLVTHLEVGRYLEFSRWPLPDSSKPCGASVPTSNYAHNRTPRSILGSLFEFGSCIPKRGYRVPLAAQVTLPIITTVLAA